MKVYKSEYQGKYGGGMILVAANNEEEALETAANDADLSWHFVDWDNNLDEDVIKCPYYFTPFTEIPNLTYETEMPVIIAKNIYIE